MSDRRIDGAGNRSPIAITGYGSVTAAGENSEAAIATLSAGKARAEMHGAGFFPGSFTAPCFVIDSDLTQSFQILPAISAIDDGPLNRTLYLALAAIDEAMQLAGLHLETMRSKRVGIALGTTVGCTFHNERYYVDWKKGNKPGPEPLFTYLSSNLAERIQQILGVHGPRVVITNACASATDAIGLAKNWLDYDFCDIAIAGGADELSRIACHGFKSLMLVSEDICQPFDHDRKGLNLGEGAGVVILEKERHAKVGMREVVGWIRGYGIGGDAHHPTAPHPEGRGLQLALRNALQDADLSVQDISMINAHGTGTPANDKAEVRAICELGFDTSLMPVVSTKGATGHTLGAAGGVEAVFTLMALNRGEIPGTIGCNSCDPEFAFKVLEHGRSALLGSRLGISQSLAFGGSNGALVIEGAGI